MARKEMFEQEILSDALNAFRRETNLEVVKGVQANRPGEEIRFEVLGRQAEYLVEIKGSVSDLVIGRLAHQFEGYPGRWLLVTRYVPQHLAKKMRELGIQFIDTVGNAYINNPPVLIFLHGNKPRPLLAFMPEQGMLSRAGLHVIFALLCRRELENATYRDIAHAAHVALGSVANVMKDLFRKGYLIQAGNEVRRLTKKKELFDKWTTAYAEKLRAKKFVGRYGAERAEFWQDVDLAPYDAQWGGEVAAHKMTGYLRPEVITIYTRRPVNDLVLALKLRKNDEGLVELRERFWRFGMSEGKELVPPLLVYADLLATADARNIETARMIYHEHLQRHFEHD